MSQRPEALMGVLSPSPEFGGGTDLERTATSATSRVTDFSAGEPNPGFSLEGWQTSDCSFTLTQSCQEDVV